MLILRGLIVALAGFVFIFLPGGIVSILTRRDLRFETNLLLWGMGVLVVTLFPALFLTSLLRSIIWGKDTLEGTMLYVFSFIGSVIAAVFLEGGKYLLMRWRQIPSEKLMSSGIMIGLGVGLLTNVFQGISLAGAGFRLVLGDTSMPDLARIASRPWLDLLAGLIALNVYRIALVAISAAMGGLVAHALITGKQRWLWLAIVINAFTAWSYNGIGLALGNESLIANIIALLYQGILAIFALRWLMHQTPDSPGLRGKARNQKSTVSKL